MLRCQFTCTNIWTMRQKRKSGYVQVAYLYIIWRMFMGMQQSMWALFDGGHSTVVKLQCCDCLFYINQPVLVDTAQISQPPTAATPHNISQGDDIIHTTTEQKSCVPFFSNEQYGTQCICCHQWCHWLARCGATAVGGQPVCSSSACTECPFSFDTIPWPLSNCAHIDRCIPTNILQISCMKISLVSAVRKSTTALS